MDFFPFGAGVDDESGGVVPNNAPYAVAAGVGGEALVIFVVGDAFIFVIEC